MPKSLTHTLLYWRTHKKHLHLKKPSTYDELVHYHIVHTYGKEYAKYADKLAVRDVVAKAGLTELLIPLAVEKTYANENEIDFDDLPETFVLKTNHASGSLHYYICRDKGKMDPDEVRVQFHKALKEDFSEKHFEYHYHWITPRIYAEKLLIGNTEMLTDYKVVCAYGEPLAILVCSERNKGKDYFDIDWNCLEYTKKEFRANHLIEKPKNLDKMLEYAAVLSKNLPLARIDFYNISGKIYFGEITLTPSNGNHKNLTDFAQHDLGKKIMAVYNSKNGIQ